MDDVKLEHRPGLLGQYQKRIKKFMSIFEGGDYGAILLTGNHDHLPTLQKEAHSAAVQIWPGVRQFSIGRLTFSAGHKYEEANNDTSQYILYGHNKDHVSCCAENGQMHLNGVEAMYLIHMQTGDVTAIPYPPGTESARHMRRRISF